jgi:hypothetical protein
MPIALAVGEIDDKFELGRLYDRYVGRFFALENAACIDADLSIALEVARTIAHKTAGFDKCALKVDSRQEVTRCKRRKLYAAVDEKRVSSDNKCFASVLHECSKGHFNFVTGTGLRNLDVPRIGRCRLFNVLNHNFGGNRIGPIDKQSDTRGARHQFQQHTQPLCAQF